MRHLFTLSLLALLSIFAQAQTADALEEGWKLFAQNDYAGADAKFESAMPTHPTRALLGRSLVQAARGSNKGSFKYFIQLYDTVEPNSPYMNAMWSIHSGKRSDEELEYLETVAERESGRLRTLALMAIGRHYLRSGKFRKADNAFEELGAVDQWRILGTFENISESGFDKDFGALSHPGPGHTFTDKRGLEVKWFDLVDLRRDRWLDFSYHFYASNAIAYAQTFCKSPKEQEVQFRMGVGGSVKVWVNDQLMIQEDKERVVGPDNYIFTVKLMPGYNRILVQIGSSEVNDCAMLLRVTDEQGRSLPDLTFEKEPQPYPTDYSYESKEVDLGIISYFQKRIEAQPDLIEPYLTLGQYYLETRRVYQAMQLLEAAKERFPDASYLNFQLLSAHAIDGNNTIVSQIVEEIKAKDPGSAVIQDKLFQEAVDLQKWTEAKSIVMYIESLQGGPSPDTYLKRINLAAQQEKMEELAQTTEEAYDRFPDHAEIARLVYMVRKDLKQKATAYLVLRKYLKNNFDEDIVRLIVDYYFNQNNAVKGTSEFEHLLEEEPIAVGYISQLASIYTLMGRYKEANKLLDRCLKIAPYIGSYYRAQARSYRELGKTERAEELLSKAVYYDTGRNPIRIGALSAERPHPAESQPHPDYPSGGLQRCECTLCGHVQSKRATGQACAH